jgi:hypothetical protein
MGADKYVAKVRALLAKAESTDILEEQAAFIAKAQELMTRHRIDAAQLVATGKAKDEPIVDRLIPVARPRQPGGKSLMTLMFAVARANGAAAVSHEGNGISATVFGAESDIRGVEMLFESLCRQLDHAASYAVKHHKPERGARQALPGVLPRRLGRGGLRKAPRHADKNGADGGPGRLVHSAGAPVED